VSRPHKLGCTKTGRQFGADSINFLFPCRRVIDVANDELNRGIFIQPDGQAEATVAPRIHDVL
jgi:hypothetical protein